MTCEIGSVRWGPGIELRWSGFLDKPLHIILPFPGLESKPESYTYYASSFFLF